MGELMPAEKPRCWRQNLKAIAQRTKSPSKAQCNGAAPAHTRSEERRKKGKENAIAEIKKEHNLGVPWRAFRL
jgi:hypothetical protein